MTEEESFVGENEVIFVEEPQDFIYECLVCLQLLKEPWLVECCGHHLCKPCIDKLLRGKKGCPHCRTGRFRHIKDKNHQRILLGKKVYCKYKSKGCSWQGTLREVDGHYSASTPCEWCQKPLLCYERKEHYKVCAVASEIVECELKEFGCSERLPRMNIHRHMQECGEEHAKMVKEASEKCLSNMTVLIELADLLEKEKARFDKERETKREEMRVSYRSLEDALQRAQCNIELFKKERIQFEEEKQIFNKERLRFQLQKRMECRKKNRTFCPYLEDKLQTVEDGKQRNDLRHRSESDHRRYENQRLQVQPSQQYEYTLPWFFMLLLGICFLVYYVVSF